MSDPRIRKAIAAEAARLMHDRQETEYFAAKRKAARRLGVDPRGDPGDLPSNAEIRDQVLALAKLLDGPRNLDQLLSMRLAALLMLRRLEAFRPRLIGSVLTGHVRRGSDIDLHVFADHLGAVTDLLDADGLAHQVETKRVRKAGAETTYVHVHVTTRHRFELTVYPRRLASFAFRSSITGKPIERASAEELAALLRGEGVDLDAALAEAALGIDRFELYRLLLLPLERVKQGRERHPEGDALYHSQQVFELARRERPHDEDFLAAALLHDVGKAIDPADHVAAGLEALDGAIGERTAFLIAHHMDMHRLRGGELGRRARRRLEADEWWDDLELLAECDRGGRVPGMAVEPLEESLAYLRQLSEG